MGKTEQEKPNYSNYWNTTKNVGRAIERGVERTVELGEKTASLAGRTIRGVTDNVIIPGIRGVSEVGYALTNNPIARPLATVAVPFLVGGALDCNADEILEGTKYATSLVPIYGEEMVEGLTRLAEVLPRPPYEGGETIAEGLDTLVDFVPDEQYRQTASEAVKRLPGNLHKVGAGLGTLAAVAKPITRHFRR
jgi:hypothetical protein